MSEGRPAGPKRTDEFTQTGISVWFLKAALNQEMCDNLRLVDLAAHTSGLDGPGGDGWRVDEIKISRDLIVRWRTPDGRKLAVMTALTMDEFGYNTRVAPGQVQRCLRLQREGGLEQVRRVTLAPAEYFEKVMDAKLATRCLTFEQVQQVASARFARLLADGLLRAARTLAYSKPQKEWKLKQKASIFACSVERRLWPQVTG